MKILVCFLAAASTTMACGGGPGEASGSSALSTCECYSSSHRILVPVGCEGEPVTAPDGSRSLTLPFCTVDPQTHELCVSRPNQQLRCYTP